MRSTHARCGVRLGGTGRLARSLGAATLAVALSAAWVGLAAASGTPLLRVVVEPLHPFAGTRAEVVAQVTPPSLGKAGGITAALVDARGAAQPFAMNRVQGGTQGTWEGLAPVAAVGTYQVRLRYLNGARVLTAARTFQVVKGSPLGSKSSFIIVVVVLGGAWFLMRRRR